MRISELLSCDAVTEDGRRLGHVMDIRFNSADGDPAKFAADGLVVGRLGFAERFGYRRGVVEGPWLVARALQWIARNGTYVAWERIRGFGDGHIIVAAEEGTRP